LFKEMPVLTKGKEGSWWETPTGNYKTLAKKINHFSSIGSVWMPYSIQFYGNFFIHGWPYYPDGTPVATSYSGGCVRLSTEDAKSVFQFATIGMPILILEESEIMESPPSVLVEKASSNLKVPVISAKSALIADLDSGLVLLDKNSQQVLPIASLVKLMTGVVASELIYLEKTVKISSLNFLQKNSPLHLASLSLLPDKSYTAFDLLYPLLMQSSNEAASLIASFLGEQEFVKKMNEKAESLGMKNTFFVDTSGKSNENVSTAKDLAKLAKYILEKRIFLYDITRGKNYLTFGPLNFGKLDNYNEFYNYPNLIGVKNGQTSAAKQTMLTVWNLRLGLNGPSKRIVIIVLGSDDRKTDTQLLLNWLKDNFDLQ
jgi:D-alanyl-D-alanine carboxypeptidase